jgi:2-alkyl-3-oxoalkanoate reductase
MGAEPAIADALDYSQIRTVVRSAQPDVIIHELTDLTGASDLRRFDQTFARSNRLRTEGTDHLLDAAREFGVKRFVAQSFCGWPYARSGGFIKSEDDPLDPTPPRQLRRSLDAIKYLEGIVAGSTSPEGIVLRYGSFYGPGTGLAEPSFIEQIRRRRVPLIGDGGAWWSFIHVDDAADATVKAVQSGTPGVYNIVDDEPALVRDWLPSLAEMLGAKPPIRVPVWLARLLAGEHLVAMMTQSRAGSNAKAKRELRWRPAHRSWREGLAEVLQTKRTAPGEASGE